MSGSRTIILGGTVCCPKSLGSKAPDAVLDFTEDMTALLAVAVAPNPGETISSLTLSISPSGAGEMTASQLSATGGLIRFWLSGGVAGRLYQVNAEATTSQNRVFQFCYNLAIDPTLAAWPVPLPPSTGFGTPITWSAA